MFSRRLKTGYFILEGLNSFALVYYFSYFYFFMEKSFGFGNMANLALAALNGAVYAVVAFWAGKFGQRFGYFTALRLGFVVMIGALTVGLRVQSASAHIVVMVIAVTGMCFTWPTLEALISEGETRRGLQHMVGTYNIVWAGTAALAYFSGGAMLDKLGYKSLFYIPIAMQLCQFALTGWLQGQARQAVAAQPLRAPASPAASLNARRSTEGDLVAPGVASCTPMPEAHPHLPATTRRFLNMAWLANPFAYIAINTLIAVMPGVAGRLGLTTTLAGFCCSIWYFARLGVFTGLWYWSGWHYRFRWLLSANVALVGSFALILLVPSLPVIVVAQVLFGGAVGLIYYSSLFYSMDLSETKSEHGGIHEAVIGLGNFAGPATGAASLYLLPQYAHSGAVAVCGLLLLGLGGVVVIWKSGGGGRAK
jgi:predicted MFS family arabinose efflux permease